MTAMVIAQSPGKTEVIRSDTVAAKVLQTAIKEGRGDQVLPTRTDQVRSAQAPATDGPSLKAAIVRPSPELRQKIDKAATAFLSLQEAFDEIGRTGAIMIESADATTVEFAKYVLGEGDPASLVLPVEDVEGALDQGGAASDDATDPVTLVIDAGSAQVELRKAVAQDTVDLDDLAHFTLVLSADAAAEKGNVNAFWTDDTLSLIFENGNSLTLRNAANAGSLMMRSGDADLTLLPPKVPPKNGLLDIVI